VSTLMFKSWCLNTTEGNQGSPGKWEVTGLGRGCMGRVWRREVYQKTRKASKMPRARWAGVWLSGRVVLSCVRLWVPLPIIHLIKQKKKRVRSSSPRRAPSFPCCTSLRTLGSELLFWVSSPIHSLWLWEVS
jgi:hypothetical protein